MDCFKILLQFKRRKILGSEVKLYQKNFLILFFLLLVTKTYLRQLSSSATPLASLHRTDSQKEHEVSIETNENGRKVIYKYKFRIPKIGYSKIFSSLFQLLCRVNSRDFAKNII